MKLSSLPVVFSRKGFHVNLVFFFILYFFIVPLIITSGIRAIRFFPILSMTTMKYKTPLLDHNTRFLLWQVKMHIVLMHIYLDDALLGFDKMSSSLTKEEKKRKHRKALS